MRIIVLGPGCQNCRTLERRALEAVSMLGVDAQVEKVEDYATIAAYGVMRTPGLVIDEQLVASGRVPSRDEIVALIQAAG